MSGSRLKICMVCHPGQGGSGIFASELGAALARRGHQVHFVTHTRPFRLDGTEPNITFHQVDVTDYPLFRYPPYSISLAGKLAQLCRNGHFDVLHVHYAIPHAISAYLSQSILHGEGPPIVTTLHGTDVTVVGTEDELNEVTGFVLNCSDRLTTVSDYLKEEAKAVYHIDREIQVLPNFVDTERFSPALRSSEQRQKLAPDGQPLIGHMSNFRPVKRIRDVLEVFRKVHRRTGARLVLIGDGPELSDARVWLREVGLLEHTIITGALQNVAPTLAQLDLFLLPSQTESFGLAALEAMASGVPVITSNAGGLPEVVRDGVDGALAPIGDTVRMSVEALRILTDPGLREKMGAAARERAVACFDMPSVVDKYEALYREAHQAKGPRDRTSIQAF